MEQRLGEEIRDKILSILDAHNVSYEHLTHGPSPTSESGMKETGAQLHEVLKTLILRGKKSGKNYLLCLLGNQRVDLKIFSTLVSEKCDFEELNCIKERFGIEKGGATPFLALIFPVEVYFDEEACVDKRVILGSGVPTESLRLNVADLIKLIHPKIESFSSDL